MRLYFGRRLSWQKQLLAEAELLNLEPEPGVSNVSPQGAVLEHVRRQQQDAERMHMTAA